MPIRMLGAANNPSIMGGVSPLECVAKAIAIIRDADVAVARGPSADEKSIADAEQKMGIQVPASYRAFLAAVGPINIEYGTDQASLLVYGLTREKTGMHDVVWWYERGRTPDARRHLGIGQMLVSPFNGPNYALDLEQPDPSSGEPPVVARKGRPGYGDPLAADFGSWLLSTLEHVVPLSVDMWNQRINYPTHSTTTDKVPEYGPPQYFSTCVCGWHSYGEPRAEALAEAARHVAYPEQMRAAPYWR